MLRELSWYLESGRYTNLAAELEGSLKKYEEAKKEGLEESALEPLREEARLLFEDHCVRSGLRENGNSFINIDAEFFDGNTLNGEAKDEFIKNIVKGHCYQKNLWLYMGTTGLMTVISKAEMAKHGLKYEDYLPIAYKTNNPPKKPLADRAGKNEELFYVYGDGTISKEYIPEKAKLRFDRLKGKSAVDFGRGWDPNGVVKKDGWHGAWDHTGTWVRQEGNKAHSAASAGSRPVTIELIRNGDGVILYDPGMLLLSSPLLMYVTESGEPYGNLALDREKTLKAIRETLEAMGVSVISAVGGISTENAETLEAYKDVLQGLAAPGIEAVGHQAVRDVKKAHEAVAVAKAAEESGVALERKLSAAAVHGGDAAAILASVASGTVVVPLSPRNKGDSAAFGLTETDAAAVNALAVRPGDEGVYDTVLSNLYAAWAYYEGGMSKGEAAALVNEYLGSRNGIKPAGDAAATINAQTTLGAIIRGEGEAARNGLITYASGIPGIFSEPTLVDFYDDAEKGKYLKSLERRRVLPKGGAVAALATLKEMPQAGAEGKAKLNKGLTRALGQYHAVAMSTGMPLAELVDLVKADAGFGKGTATQATMGKKVYYEVAVEDLVAEAGKENLQKKEISLTEESAKIQAGNAVIIGGVQGPALDEVVFTREKLMGEYGFSAEEAAKAQPFLHNVRLAGENPVIPLFLAEALVNDKATNAEGLRRSIINSLNTHGVAAYNLSTNEGMQAYYQSGRAGSKVTPNDIQALLREQPPRSVPVSRSLYSRLEPKYKASGGAVTFNRETPKGSPEKIRFAGVSGGYGAAGMSALADALLAEGPVAAPGGTMGGTFETVPFKMGPVKGYAGKSGVIVKPGFSLEATPPQSPAGAAEALASTTTTTGKEVAMPLLAQQPRDAELERLRKIEANYEKDKAELARRKQPALARSESHDIGHAEGMGIPDAISSNEFNRQLINKIFDSLKRNAGQ